MSSVSVTDQVAFVGPPPEPTVVIQPSKGLFRLDLRAVWQYRELVYFLVWRDIKVRYKQTAIGAAWAILQPLMTIHVRYHDVGHATPFLIQFWMYASPVVYPVSLVPERWRLLYSLNPMAGVIEGFRWALLATDRPDFTVMAISAAVVLSFPCSSGGSSISTGRTARSRT